MAVPDQVPFNQSAANGVTTVFPYTFLIVEESQLAVYLDGVLQASGYTVSGVGVAGGGNVTFSTAPANGVVVERIRETALTRTTDYPPNGDLLESTLDADFDKTWQAMQEINEHVERAIKLPLGSTADPVLAPLVANRYFKVNAAGTGIDQVAGFETAGVVVITPYAETLAASADIATAQGVLGMTAFAGTLVDDANATDARATLGIDAALVKSLMPSGSVLNSVYAETTTHTKSSTTIPLDDTIPQSTEGVEILTGTITPSSTSSKIRVRVVVPVASPTGEGVTVALFRDSVANALCAVASSEGVSPGPEGVPLAYEYAPGSASAITLKVRVGSSGGGDFGVNGDKAPGTRIYGGVSRATMIIEEIKV